MSDDSNTLPDDKTAFTLPDIATVAGANYFNSTTKTFSMFMFIIDLALGGDFAAFIAREALEYREYPKDLTPSDLAGTQPGQRTKFLRKVSQEFLEMIVCRVIDNFEEYLSELIREVLQSKPEILRSQEQVKIEFILQYGTIEDLRSDLIDRKVSELGYLGFTELEKWCKERMGITLLEDNAAQNKLIEFIETRNIIVHNRGIINNKYLSKVHDSPFKRGDLRKLDVDYLFLLSSEVNSFVLSLDRRIGEKYSLDMKPYNNKESD